MTDRFLCALSDFNQSLAETQNRPEIKPIAEDFSGKLKARIEELYAQKK